MVALSTTMSIEHVLNCHEIKCGEASNGTMKEKKKQRQQQSILCV